MTETAPAVRWWLITLCLAGLGMLPGCARDRDVPVRNPEIVRVATFNIENITKDELADPSNARLKKAASIVQRIAPDIILINEIPYDAEFDAAGRFAREFCSVTQPNGRGGLRYTAYAWPSNTGVHSGFDLNRDGQMVTEPGSRDYGNDCLGYGEYPGHYAMAVLVREGFEVDVERVRTFKDFLWKDMPGALLPMVPGTGEAWYSGASLGVFPLSSKSHWDVPVRVPNGAVLHLLASHPTPPTFDGEEDRNGRRNHDEIRFWRDYIDGRRYIYDDAGNVGGLPGGAHFVIAGDLNADPDEGQARNNPIGNLLLSHPRIAGEVVPMSSVPLKDTTLDDTAFWGLRADYVLPSDSVGVIGAGVWRGTTDDPAVRLAARNNVPVAAAPEEFPSDHFPVWIELVVPGP